jgi:hypothetical protein
MPSPFLMSRTEARTFCKGEILLVDTPAHRITAARHIAFCGDCQAIL